ncbi:MalY/PatB family protein [Clostridium sp. KNHs205]|uniref:MalY/PatB family protein n=1 Tax=Clostridium sp. KNHs205 TaxID=1449050 RepID=UPI00051C9654|nr:MalY/PatB family protein [Clostridium sp. KNHs205]
MGFYDFDKKLDRENTSSVKWSFIKEHTGVEDAIPLWVADMDFETVPEIIEKLAERAQHGIYGYTARTENYYRELIKWYGRRQGFHIRKEWITHSSGVVNAIYNIIYALSEEGEGVIIQPPVYHPFARAIALTGRKVLNNPLIIKNGRYEIDFEGLEIILKEGKARLLLLCNPHNPVGRVFTYEELKQLGELSIRYGVTVISDEIHSDFIYKDQTFVPFASVSEELEQNSIICTAPSKTFNLAGLSTSNIIIPNKNLRGRYDNYCELRGVKSFNIFGAIASETAYQYGEPWLEELLVYLEENKDYAISYLQTYLPEVKVIKPEGTYFLWVDFSELEYSKEELEEFLIKEARIWLNQGYIFGKEGEGFARINLACRKDTLKEALGRLQQAIKKAA